MKKILLIPHIEILNANALSSPYTIGFPAMTAWLGATHALQRKLQASHYEDLKFKSMAVICHEIDLQTYKGATDYVHSVIGTGNPLNKNGNRPSFIEEARCHLDVSLAIECDGLGVINYDALYEKINQIILGHMKFAGGDSLKCGDPQLLEIDDDSSLRRLLRRLMPGHCLIERRDLMKQSMEDGQDAIDALLDHIKVTHECKIGDNETITWKSTRKEKGWIVPIATGFHGISELGIAVQQRDPDTQHRFAESVVTLGEFVMPYRIDNLDNMLWHYYPDLENNLYLCQQNTSITDIQEITHG
ncbi:MAG: type I-F CRISPR-associated protein Csy2 [Gammaproteobacteria bacterium]|nr:MAG: type I-F CRISPR-associated protein Csy2 [Gammaproteobacteria bacterium]